MSEKEWVASFVARLEAELAPPTLPGVTVKATDGTMLTYARHVDEYDTNGTAVVNHPSKYEYETDILICDALQTGSWIPRIVVECKLGGITTHDALIYSAKAATHKQIHPYLRYGFLAGAIDGIPPRLVKHGAHFDFMATWRSEAASPNEWKFLLDTLGAEIGASRELQQFLNGSHAKERIKYQGLHRPLKLTRQ